MNYRYERLTSNNFSDLEALFDIVYPRQLNNDLLRRKFDTSMFNLSYIGFLAYHTANNEVAAYYGVFPLRVRLKGQTYLAAQSGDTMTHPLHRGKGLFVTLAKRTYDLCRSSGVDFVFGYPNENSFPGFIKHLEWKHAHNMVGWNRFIPTIPLATILKLLKCSRVHENFTRWVFGFFFIVRSPKDAADVLASLPNIDGVIHDRQFVAYKCRTGFVLEHSTACIWVKYCTESIEIGLIDDNCEGSDALVALRRLSVVCLLTGINRIKTYFSPGHGTDQLLKGKGLRRNSNPFGYYIFNNQIDISAFETKLVDYDTF